MFPANDYLLVWFKCCLSELRNRASQVLMLPYSNLSIFLQKHPSVSSELVTGSDFMQDFLALVNPKEFQPLEPVCATEPASGVDKQVCLLMQLKGFFKRRGFTAAGYFSRLRNTIDTSETNWEILHLIFLVTFLISKDSSNGTLPAGQVSKFFSQLFATSSGTNAVLLQSTLQELCSVLAHFVPNNDSAPPFIGYEELAQIMLTDSASERKPIVAERKAARRASDGRLQRYVEERTADAICAAMAVNVSTPPAESASPTAAAKFQKLAAEVKQKGDKIVALKERLKSADQLICDFRQTHRLLEEKVRQYQYYESLYKQSLLDMGDLQVQLKDVQTLKEDLSRATAEAADLKETLKFYKTENSNLRTTMRSPGPESFSTSASALRSPDPPNILVDRRPSTGSVENNGTPATPTNLERQILESCFTTPPPTEESGVQTDTDGRLLDELHHKLREKEDNLQKMIDCFRRLADYQETQKEVVNNLREKVDKMQETCAKYLEVHARTMRLAKTLEINNRQNRFAPTTINQPGEGQSRSRSVKKATIGILLTGIVCAASASITYIVCK